MKELTIEQREHWKQIDKNNCLTAEARLEQAVKEVESAAKFLAHQEMKLNCNHPDHAIHRTGNPGVPTCKLCGSNPCF